MKKILHKLLGILLMMIVLFCDIIIIIILLVVFDVNFLLGLLIFLGTHLAMEKTGGWFASLNIKNMKQFWKNWNKLL